MKNVISFVVAIFTLITCVYAELPRLDDVEITTMIIGEHIADYYTEVQLYYESGNGMELTGVTRNIYVPIGGSLIIETLNELFEKDEDQNYISPMPGDAYIKSVRLNCGIATVDLCVNMGAVRNEGDLVSMIMAISNTLIRIDGVDCVNVLINSKQESICGLPMGVLYGEETSIAATWSGLQAESEFIKGSSSTEISIERDVVVYFPSVNGQWLLPEIRNISFSEELYAEALITELMKGPSAGGAYASFISNGANIMTEETEICTTVTGERILSISLRGIVRDYLLLQGIPDWQFAGAITLTMTSFVPEIDGILLYIDGKPYTRMNIRGNYHEFPEGILRCTDFEMFTGSVCQLYFSDNDGHLVPVQRSMSVERAISPYALLIQLISGPSTADEGMYRTMPAGVTVNDLLGVEVTDCIATVNMSANFYRLCQALNEEEEQTLVYSIVNTLCQLPGINAVRIRIEGERIDTLAGSIYLLSELIPNPGIIR